VIVVPRGATNMEVQSAEDKPVRNLVVGLVLAGWVKTENGVKEAEHER
jgi:hypothetical protein